MRPWAAILTALAIAAAPSLSLGQATIPNPGTLLRGSAQPDAAKSDPTLPTPDKDAGVPLQSPSPYALPTLTPPRGPYVSPLTLQDQAQAQCSTRCARDYYFCLAGENPDFCPPSWSQCTAACSIAARRPAG